MRTLTTLMAVAALSLVVGCGDDDDVNQNQNNNNQVQDDATVQADAGDEVDAASDDGGTTGDQGIGSACACTDTSTCEQMGVPIPNGTPITGCDDVPTQTGAELVCLRSYSGSLATDTFFANGYCGLMATTCTGADLICNSAVFGDYDTMTACPAGMVLVEDSQDVEVFGNQATIQNKVCAKPCTGAGECREDETDPALQDEATQYACQNYAGVRFCYDPRNLSANYTATQF